MSGVRADGATRGDLTEATSLVVAGGVLLFLPVLAMLDRLGSTWVWLSACGALGGAIIAGLGVRWFLVEGPALVALGPDGEPRVHRAEPIALPAGVRLVEMRARLFAHGLRFTALAAGALLVFVDVGPLKWAVLLLFFVSFVADQLLLRPTRWVLDEAGLTSKSFLGRRSVAWTDVQSVFWRHYPDAAQPPFPSGERVIIEQEGDTPDLEFVFHKRGVGTAGVTFVQALAPLVGDRLRVLRPRGVGRVDVDAPALSELLEASAPQ
ncbi:MAG: hypothetical protein KDA24_06030 [Deltaproteobacteria bacterium]|nr:hypothetical protein [Deltaproteobacteria bacterium]